MSLSGGSRSQEVNLKVRSMAGLVSCYHEATNNGHIRRG